MKSWLTTIIADFNLAPPQIRSIKSRTDQASAIHSDTGHLGLVEHRLAQVLVGQIGIVESRAFKISETIRQPRSMVPILSRLPASSRACWTSSPPGDGGILALEYLVLLRLDVSDTKELSIRDEQSQEHRGEPAAVSDIDFLLQIRVEIVIVGHHSADYQPVIATGGNPIELNGILALEKLSPAPPPLLRRKRSA